MTDPARLLLRHLSCLTLLLTVLAGAAAYGSQTPEPGLGGIGVTVSDETGGRVANAQVVLTRDAVQHSRVTDANGTVQVGDLEPGEWILIVSRQGFRVFERALTIGVSRDEMAVTLEVAGLGETIRVRGTALPEAVQLRTTATGGTNLDIPVRELPASLSIITGELIEQRGAWSGTEAVELAVGMNSQTGVGSIPSYSTRGFSGNSVSIMRDGIRQNTASQSSRASAPTSARNAFGTASIASAARTSVATTLLSRRGSRRSGSAASGTARVIPRPDRPVPLPSVPAHL